MNSNRFALPTQHLLYFGIQTKCGKLDASGVPKAKYVNVAEAYQQALMMIDQDIFDLEIGKHVLVDHAFIVAWSRDQQAGTSLDWQQARCP